MSTSNNHGFNTIFNSQLPKREQRALLRRIAIAACCGVLALILILSISMAIYTAFSGPNDPSIDPVKNVTYTDKTLSDIDDDKKFDSLVLVDETHTYTPNDQLKLKFISAAFSSNDQDYHDTYLSEKMEATALEALKNMIMDQYSQYQAKIMIRYAYLDRNKDGYPLDTDELCTGLVAELKIAKEANGRTNQHLSYNPDVEAWFKGNAHKYGFILTKNTDYFRYVGVAHATYIYNYNVEKNTNIALGDYLQQAMPTFSQSNPLAITGADGNEYLVYYYANVNDDTIIKVPTNCEYTVSGDNMGGLIITVNKSAPVTPESETGSESVSENVSDTTPASDDEA